jgi:hypothetical protein
MAKNEIIKALEESGLQFKITGAEPTAIDTGIACVVGSPPGGCNSCKSGCMNFGCQQGWCLADGCYNVCSAGNCTAAGGCYNWFAALKPTA